MPSVPKIAGQNNPAKADSLPFEDALKKLLEAAKADLAKEETADQNVQTERRPRSAGLGFSHYLAGLAHLGLGENESAKQQFMAALAASPDLLGAKAALNGLR